MQLANPCWEAPPTPRVSRPTAVRTLHIHGVTDYGSYLSPLPEHTQDSEHDGTDGRHAHRVSCGPALRVPGGRESG